MILKFYISVAEVLKLKVGKFWPLTPTIVEISGKKTRGRGRGAFCPPMLNMVKGWNVKKKISYHLTWFEHITVALNFVSLQRVTSAVLPKYFLIKTANARIFSVGNRKYKFFSAANRNPYFGLSHKPQTLNINPL